MISQDLVLQTDKVLLRPLDASDYDSFYALCKNDESMWEYFTLNLSNPLQLRKWMDEAITARAAGTRIPFTIIEKSTGTIAGSSSFGNISYYDKRIEIGWSWLATDFRSTGINVQAKFLLMHYAFEYADMERVEFKTGIMNIRARKGLEKIGGVEEGALRSHTLLWNGHRRTSVIYSVLKDEWAKNKTTIFAGIVAV